MGGRLSRNRNNLSDDPFYSNQAIINNTPTVLPRPSPSIPRTRPVRLPPRPLVQPSRPPLPSLAGGLNAYNPTERYGYSTFMTTSQQLANYQLGRNPIQPNTFAGRYAQGKRSIDHTFQIHLT